MKAYLDASVLVALLTVDALTGRADAFLRKAKPVLLLSDFSMAEFASAIARRVRMKELLVEDARAAFSTLDAWIAKSARRIETHPADIRQAEDLIRKLEHTLRTPDAIHLAMSQRIGASLVTFDEKLASIARAIGADVAEA